MTGQDTPRGPAILLRPVEVQRVLGVGRTTLHDYEAAGRIKAQRTPGGHRRYPADQPALQTPAYRAALLALGVIL